MEHFATLFDRTFLPQGLALIYSLQRRVKHYKLWVICMDEDCYSFLSQKAFPFIACLRISELETNELKSVKKTRSKGEYCWTVTPFVPRFIFAEDNSVDRVTYLDSDLWFLQDPNPIFEEFAESGKSVLITEHAYAPEYEMSEKFGKYCVQFMIFERYGSEEVRAWWESRCLEWCYNRMEDGKFGDQMYLDRFEDLFDGNVHVLQSKEYALAPWNASVFDYRKAVFYHFHSVRFLNDKKIHLGVYELPVCVHDNIYRPYYLDLCEAMMEIHASGLQVFKQTSLYFVLRTSLKRLAYFIRMKSFKILMVESLSGKS